jgi:hypothetical protein
MPAASVPPRPRGPSVLPPRYDRPLRLPAPLILGPALNWLAARIGGSLSMQLRGERPHVTGPLCAAAQMLNVARPGEEPGLEAAEEDTRLLFGGDEPQGARGLGLWGARRASAGKASRRRRVRDEGAVTARAGVR